MRDFSFLWNCHLKVLKAVLTAHLFFPRERLIRSIMQGGGWE